MTNFTFWIQSIANDIGLFLSRIFYNSQFVAFTAGFILSALIIGYIVTQNPRHIPVILRYSVLESYNLIAKHHPKSKLAMKQYDEFVKIYMTVRILLSLVFIVFFAFVLVTMVRG